MLHQWMNAYHEMGIYFFESSPETFCNDSCVSLSVTMIKIQTYKMTSSVEVTLCAGRHSLVNP